MIAEHHIAVAKTARYCSIGTLDKGTSELWIVCHGFGDLAREFLASFEGIARRPGCVVVAPEALSRFYKTRSTVHTRETPVGATWMTSEDRQNEIADYIAYLDTLMGALLPAAAEDVQVTALGFSQGAATVSRWAAASRPRLKRLILWGGLLPPEFADASSVEGLLAQPLSLVIGSEDEYFSEKTVEVELNRLLTLGIPFSLEKFKGAHVLDQDTLARLAGK